MSKKNLKSAIVVFSPHNNTLKVAEKIKSSFDEQGVESDLINLTGKSWDEISNFDYSVIENYDLLIVGSPVYAWEVIEPIEKFLLHLPTVKDKYVGLFVTYGLISGYALFQAAKLLNKKGYRILGAAKIVARHSMTFEEKDDPFRFHPNEKDFEKIKYFTQSLVKKLNNSSPESIPLHALTPKSLTIRFFSKFITRYGMTLLPGVHFNGKPCIKCGKCAEFCPLKLITLEPYPKKDGKCIKCYNCLRVCPTNAYISPTMWTFDVFHKLVSKFHSEKPWSEIYV